LDLILDAGDGTCISGIDQGSAPYILGDTFQKNVITVFDVGGVELSFAAHEDYTSNDTY
jgi:Eukaryotic aspartyl protease